MNRIALGTLEYFFHMPLNTFDKNKYTEKEEQKVEKYRITKTFYRNFGTMEPIVS